MLELPYMEHQIINQKIAKSAEKIKILAEKYQLELVLIFGSRVSGRTHPLSDYDFGYIGNRQLDYEEEYSLQKELAAIFEIKMNKREDIIEIVNIKNLNPLFKYRILKNKLIVYQNKGAYSRFFVSALQEYFESEGLFKTQQTLIKNKINAIKSNL